MCGAFIKRGVKTASVNGDPFARKVEFGVGIGGPTILSPLAPVGFPTCTAPIRMAVQARLFTKDRVTLVKEAPRAPMTGLVTAARLSSNGDTGWRRGFRALRVKGNVHVAAPASAQSGSYVVGITYDYQNTDTDTIRCKTVVPNEEYRCEFFSEAFQ